MFVGGGGDQHPASGPVSQRETRRRAEEETRPQPAQRIQAEPHQELAGRPDLQRVRINQTGALCATDETDQRKQSQSDSLCSEIIDLRLCGLQITSHRGRRYTRSQQTL